MTKIITDLGNEYAENDKDKQALAQWRTQAEAAEILGIDQHKLIDCRKYCLIPAYKIGRQWLYKLSDLDRLKFTLDEPKRILEADEKEQEENFRVPSFDDSDFDEYKIETVDEPTKPDFTRPCPWDIPKDNDKKNVSPVLDGLTFTGIPDEFNQLFGVIENRWKRVESMLSVMKENLKRLKELKEERK